MSESRRIRRPSPEEDEAINRGIAEDPDTWVPTNEEWARMKPLSEVDPALFRLLIEKQQADDETNSASSPAKKRSR